MDTITVYIVKTDIVKEDKTKLQFNVIGENLVDATNSASYLKYNGEELKRHIVSIELIVSNVIRDSWSVKDLNPDYTGESKDNQDALPPTDNI